MVAPAADCRNDTWIANRCAEDLAETGGRSIESRPPQMERSRLRTGSKRPRISLPAELA